MSHTVAWQDDVLSNKTGGISPEGLPFLRDLLGILWLMLSNLCVHRLFLFVCLYFFSPIKLSLSQPTLIFSPIQLRNDCEWMIVWCLAASWVKPQKKKVLLRPIVVIELILRKPLEHGNIITYVPVTDLLILSQITPRPSGKFLGPFLTCSLFWRRRDTN